MNFVGNISSQAAPFACRYGRRLALLTATVLLFVACFAQAGDPGALIKERCLECHGMDKTCAVTTDDPQWWNETVLRMVEYKNDLIAEDEVGTVSLFLADAKKRATLCSSN